jgi:hypothetical protein
MDAWVASPLPCTPPVLTDASVVVPAIRSRTKTSCRPLVSPGTMFGAVDVKATYLPSDDDALR